MIGHAASATRIVGVSRLGESAARRLAASPRVTGRVHSVFERAVNLLGADGRLLTLQGPGPLATPFAVALDERLPWRELEPGLPVEREGRGRLVLGSCSQTLCQSPHRDCRRRIGRQQHKGQSLAYGCRHNRVIGHHPAIIQIVAEEGLCDSLDAVEDIPGLGVAAGHVHHDANPDLRGLQQQ